MDTHKDPIQIVTAETGAHDEVRPYGQIAGDLAMDKVVHEPVFTLVSTSLNVCALSRNAYSFQQPVRYEVQKSRSEEKRNSGL
jgi:hypothetical protein